MTWFSGLTPKPPACERRFILQAFSIITSCVFDFITLFQFALITPDKLIDIS
jgi:hypothetical protein